MPVDAHLEEGHDPGVVEARGGLRLAHDAVGVPDHHLLDSHVALQALVEGAIDRPHAPRTDPLGQAESIHHHFADHSFFRFGVARLAPAYGNLPAPTRGGKWPPAQVSYSLGEGRSPASPIWGAGRERAPKGDLWLSSTRTTHSNRPDPSAHGATEATAPARGHTWRGAWWAWRSAY